MRRGLQHEVWFMTVQAMSVILYTALQTMQPCEKVFVDTALAANPHFKTEEMSYLEEFAKASCATSFPDILWLLAFQETSFRFVIVRENKGLDFCITQGKEALDTLKQLKNNSSGANPPSQNVDIGVMQFNWRWHGKNFDQDPTAALSPTRQVKYFLENYSRYIVKVCNQTWVGCYHNQTNPILTNKYQGDITKKTVVLTAHSLRFLKLHRSRLTGEALDQLPPIKLADIRKSFAYIRSFPKPEKKKLEYLITEIAMRSSHQGTAARIDSRRQ